MILMRFSFLFLVNKKCHQSLQNSQLKVYHYLYNNIELIQRKLSVMEKMVKKSTLCLVCWKWTKHLKLMSWKKLKSVL